MMMILHIRTIYGEVKRYDLLKINIFQSFSSMVK